MNQRFESSPVLWLLASCFSFCSFSSLTRSCSLIRSWVLDVELEFEFVVKLVFSLEFEMISLVPANSRKRVSI